MTYYWTTFEERGSEVQINQGGYYEALDRDSEPARVKMGSGGITPSSDVAELCVSGTPEASLFAKIQSARRTGVYHIYQTDEKPDTKPSRTTLDFGVIEEYRYNMDKRKKVVLKHFESVNISTNVVSDIELCYKYAESNSVNSSFANAVKKQIEGLINIGTYSRESLRQVKENEFEDFADAYGFDMAKRRFEEVPDGIEKNDF